MTGLTDAEVDILRRFDYIEARTARDVELPIQSFRWLMRHHYIRIASGPHPLRFQLTLRGYRAIIGRVAVPA